MRRALAAMILLPSAVLLTGCAPRGAVAANVALQFPEGPSLLLYVYGPLLVVVGAIVVGAIDLVVLSVTVRRAQSGQRASVGLLRVCIVMTALLVVFAVAVVVYIVATLTPLFSGSIS